MTDPAEIYLSPPCCSDMVGEGRLWCENDEWPEGDCGTPEEHRPATRYVRADLAHADLMSTERVIMVRESEWRQMREALAKCAEGWGNAVEFDLLPPRHHAAATYLRDEARAALAKSEAVP